MKENHYVACTIMVKDEEGRYVFLVSKENDGYAFLATNIKPEQTGLASVIERLKEIASFRMDYLELNELTNAIVKETSIPLFVFLYEGDEVTNPDDLLLGKEDLSWVHSENIVSTLEQWKISGVPQFLLI